MDAIDLAVGVLVVVIIFGIIGTTVLIISSRAVDRW